mmetsp:Transcript_38145/g.43540  ORF Transcript_38145/g.43540 Transcript_38145/m.43540 type:complete len:366 (+) Transcript_38145:25-1122(+)
MKTKTKPHDESKKRKKKDTIIIPQDKNFPYRDLTDLFVSQDTLSCAIHNLCVPCAYKIGNFDVALDKYFSMRSPNQRPELCPRLMNNKKIPYNEDKTHYIKKGMKVLTCGDGDFSFSLALARLLFPSNTKGDGLSSTLIATSYESKSTLTQVYPNLIERIKELEHLGCTVLFHVDATNLGKMTTATTSTKIIDHKFDRIVWNFPCRAGNRGKDGQNDAMEENKRLIRHFAQNARFHLADGGEIHICHKTKPPFNQWKLENIVDTSCQEGIKYEFLGKIVLDRAIIPPYVPRKALDKKSFPCHDACTYIFRLKSTGRFLPTLNHEKSPFERVTIEIIEKIRAAHLERVQPGTKSVSRKKRKKISGK